MGGPTIRQYWSSFGNIFKRKTHPDIRLDYTSARQQVRWLILHVEYAAVVGTPQTDLQRSPIWQYLLWVVLSLLKIVFIPCVPNSPCCDCPSLKLPLCSTFPASAWTRGKSHRPRCYFSVFFPWTEPRRLLRKGIHIHMKISKFAHSHELL